MTRAAAITNARAGASRLWAGTLVVQPHAKTASHHHGEFGGRCFTSCEIVPDALV